MRRRVVVVSLLLLGSGLLAGCGQKGALVLPGKPALTAPASAASAAKPANASAPHGA